jgi:hypothetical protein
LLAILATGRFILYLQLGDGDIVAVNDRGEVRKPVAKDDRLLGNETTSLCLARAAQDMRVTVAPIDGDIPALVVVSTDGYANSFRDEEGFLKVGADLLEMIRADGLDPIAKSLADWLNDTSQHGSGDDITVGLLCRADICSGRRQESGAATDGPQR